jgi:protoporphyrinogen oxidase
MKKIAIIGTGISGISAGRMLMDGYNVTLFEKETNIGGLIKCERVNDNLFHKVGGHVFNSKNEEVKKWFWKHFDQEKEFVSVKRKAGILLNNQYLGYPIENYVYQLDKKLQQKIIDELLQIYKSGYSSSINDYASFESFLLGRFGNTLYELYFKPYNYKIWNTDLSEVPLSWLEGKLPMPEINQIFLSNIQREEETVMVHSSFYYPVNGGSQFIIDRLSEGLDIKTGFSINSIAPYEEGYILNDHLYFDAVIYSGDVRQIGRLITFNDPVVKEFAQKIESLKSNGTSNLFCETDQMHYTWLYLPDKNTQAHRIIYTGNLSDNNNRGSKRRTCVVEFSGKVSYEDMCAQIKELPGNLSPLSYNYEPKSYIIHDKETSVRVKLLKDSLDKKNFFLLGRFAEWEYYNMDKCIESAMEVTKKIAQDQQK